MFLSWFVVFRAELWNRFFPCFIFFVPNTWGHFCGFGVVNEKTCTRCAQNAVAWPHAAGKRQCTGVFQTYTCTVGLVWSMMAGAFACLPISLIAVGVCSISLLNSIASQVPYMSYLFCFVFLCFLGVVRCLVYLFCLLFCASASGSVLFCVGYVYRVTTAEWIEVRQSISQPYLL